MVNNKEFSKSNAIPTTFGFEFQAMAGLMLVLENLKEVNRFSIEGPLEDIELELNNGNYIYAQVKSKETNTQEKKSNFDKLKEGLNTLNEDSKERDAEKLIYVSNTYYPLGTKKIFESLWPYSSTKSKYKYTDDSFNSIVSNSKKFENLLNKYSQENPNFKKELFEIYFYKFLNSSYEETKYEVFYKEIELYISNISKNFGKYYKDVFSRWYTIIRQSETSRQDYSKKHFLWQLVELLSEKADIEPFLEYMELEDDEFDEFKLSHLSILNDIEGRFELSNRILGRFKDMRDRNELGPVKNRKFVFISKCWEEFKNEIFSSDNSETEEIIVKYAIWKIIANKKLIQEVRKSGNI
ncbi:hypothetical protein HO995_09220 [Streptococcus suis]|uniref:hypothetical protein n=1 Tax=Streptococcus parasuis TaxID=1501662 RepID=UPI001554E667|nr:hypothetical protein [Streptococcus suis]